MNLLQLFLMLLGVVVGAGIILVTISVVLMAVYSLWIGFLNSLHKNKQATLSEKAGTNGQWRVSTKERGRVTSNEHPD